MHLTLPYFYYPHEGLSTRVLARICIHTRAYECMCIQRCFYDEDLICCGICATIFVKVLRTPVLRVLVTVFIYYVFALIKFATAVDSTKSETFQRYRFHVDIDHAIRISMFV